MDPSTVNFSNLESIIRKYMRINQIPGCAVSIFRENRIIYSKGFGARDLEANLPMTPHTLIGIGSITKSFTAFAIMKLVEKKLLSLEDSVALYLKIPPFTTHPDIKIKHILSHSSGISAADAGMFPLFYALGNNSRIYPTTSHEDFFAHLGEPESYIRFKPGEKFFYNNDMYTCLGFIIEQLSKSTYVDFIRKEILSPLGITRAVFNQDELVKDPEKDFMTGYLPKKEGETTTLKRNVVPMYEFLQAPGGIYISMEDLLQYAWCLLEKGIYQGQKLLSPPSVTELWTPRIKSPYGFSTHPQYCLGWVEDINYFPAPFYHHGGGLGTSCAFLGLIPELKIAVAIGLNSCTGISSVIGRAAIASLLQVDPLKHVEELRIYSIIEQITGIYKSPLQMYSLKVHFKGGILTADIEIDDGPFSVTLLPNNLDQEEFLLCFTIPFAKEFIKFHRNPSTNQVEFATFDRYLYMKS